MLRLRSLLLLHAVLLAVASPSVIARADEDPDTEVAKRHFKQGSAYYSENNYGAALVEFSAARRVLSLPAIDYNIARCYDRLEDYPNAVEFYRRYVEGAPGAADAEETRARIVLLKKRMAEPIIAPSRPATTPGAPQPVAQVAPASAAPTEVAIAPANPAPAPQAAEPQAVPANALVGPASAPPPAKRTWPVVVGVVAGVVVAGAVVGVGLGVGLGSGSSDGGLTASYLPAIQSTP